MATAAAIDPEAIRQQWREARGDAAWTATMNFIVYVEDPEFREWVLERAQMIADKHPSRMVVLDASPGMRGARVITGEGGTNVRERVDIGIDGVRAAERVHLVDALRVSDVPVVLWWACERLFTSNTFQALLEHVEHVIVDSSGTERDPKAIKEYAHFFDRPHDVVLRDLAWMRLEPWRDVVAQFFDDPGLRQELLAIRKVEICSGSEAEALYLGGWLGSRLGWTVCDACTFCDSAGLGIPFTRTCEGEIRRVGHITITTESSTYIARAGEGAVVLSVGGKHAGRPRLVPLQAIDNASLIERAILEMGHDDVFETSLRSVGELLKD